MPEKISSGEAAALIALAIPPRTPQFKAMILKQLGPEALKVAEAMDQEFIEDEDLRWQVQQYRNTAKIMFNLG